MTEQTHGTEDRAYVRDYLQRAQQGHDLEAPDLRRANGSGPILTEIYVSSRKSADYARSAVEIALRTNPDLAELMNVVEPSRTWKIFRGTEIDGLPKQEYYTPDGGIMLPKGGLIELHGAPGGGKTHIMLRLALRLAQDRNLMYTCAEGRGGIAARQRAQLAPYPELKPDRMHYAFEPVNLLDDTEVQAFIDTTKPLNIGVYIFDTLARCMVGGDENSARDMGRVVSNLGHIQRQTGATVIVVHHTGKSGMNYRGSSALEGAADCMIELSDLDGVIVLKNVKQKDAPAFEPHYFKLVQMGDSCLPMPSDKVFETEELSVRQLDVLEKLSQSIFADAGAKFAQIKESTELHPNTLTRILSKLKDKGYISQGAKGDPYRITEAGREAVTVVTHESQTVNVTNVTSTPNTQSHTSHTPFRGVTEVTSGVSGSGKGKSRINPFSKPAGSEV